MKRRVLAAIPTLPLALVGVAVAAAMTGGALMRALRAPATTTVAAETIAIPAMVRARGGDPLDLAPIADDPFHPTRTPPAKRYRLADAMAQLTTGLGPDERGPTVLGTVVGAHDSSFAICSVENEPPKTIRVGESIGGYRAEAIERGRVVFLSPEGRKVAVSSTTTPRRRLRFPNSPFNQLPDDPQTGLPAGDSQGTSGGESTATPDADNSGQD
jgi:hypothetical protein